MSGAPTTKPSTRGGGPDSQGKRLAVPSRFNPRRERDKSSVLVMTPPCVERVVGWLPNGARLRRSGGSAWESNPKPLNKRNQATSHANSSFRPSEQRVDRRLDLFARPRHYPQMRLSFGDSLETGFDDNPGGTAGSVGYGDRAPRAHRAAGIASDPAISPTERMRDRMAR